MFDLNQQVVLLSVNYYIIIIPSLCGYCTSSNYIVLVESPDNKDRFFVYAYFKILLVK